MSGTIESDAGRERGLGEYLDVAGKAVAAAAAALLVLSTSYDFSFLHALGLSFEEVPTALSDQVRSAVVWGPKLCIYCLGFATYEMLMRWSEKGLSEGELIARSKNPRFTRAFRKGPGILFALLFPVFLVSDFLLTSSDRSFYFGALIAWGTLSGAIIAHPRLGLNLPRRIKILFVSAPILIIYVGMLGYLRGESMMTNNQDVWRIQFKDVKAGEISVVGLRRFSTSAILVSKGRQVEVRPNDDITYARLIPHPAEDIPRFCRWLGKVCSVNSPR